MKPYQDMHFEIALLKISKDFKKMTGYSILPYEKHKDKASLKVAKIIMTKFGICQLSKNC